jgi:hypothetical protein
MSRMKRWKCSKSAMADLPHVALDIGGDVARVPVGMRHVAGMERRVRAGDQPLVERQPIEGGVRLGIGQR